MTKDLYKDIENMLMISNEEIINEENKLKEKYNLEKLDRSIILKEDLEELTINKGVNSFFKKLKEFKDEIDLNESISIENKEEEYIKKEVFFLFKIKIFMLRDLNIKKNNKFWKSLLKNKVSNVYDIENLKNMITCIYKDILSYEKHSSTYIGMREFLYPESLTHIKKFFGDKLDEELFKLNVDPRYLSLKNVMSFENINMFNIFEKHKSDKVYNNKYLEYNEKIRGFKHGFKDENDFFRKIKEQNLLSSISEKDNVIRKKKL